MISDFLNHLENMMSAVCEGDFFVRKNVKIVSYD